jgi:hypothetical protein
VRLARSVFRAAGVYGMLVLLPHYFLEERVGTDYPPPITHPEFFYGFVGVALVWQVAYLLIAQDPLRFRPFMLVAVLAKASFGIAVSALFLKGRVPGLTLGFGAIDLVLGVLFFISWLRLR